MARPPIPTWLPAASIAAVALSVGGFGGSLWSRHPSGPGAGFDVRLAGDRRSAVAGSPIAPVDHRLEEPAPDFPGRMLPSRGPRGLPRERYAAGAPVVLPGQARIALLVDGTGLDHTASLHAIDELPASVSFAFSPYAHDIAALVAASRADGHEMLASIPMEPAASPRSDEGDRQIVAIGTDEANARNLEWALSAIEGAVGATGAETGQSGERVASDRRLLGDLLHEIDRRGLLYIDAMPGNARTLGIDEAVADDRIEPNQDAAGLIADLQAAAQRAVTRGVALETLEVPGPSALARIMAWSRTLPGRGIVLVPVSELASVTTRTASLESPAGSDTLAAASRDP